MVLKIIFWILFFILFYTYIGYALILFLLKSLKSVFSRLEKTKDSVGFEPEVCLFVTAFNEKDYVEQKIENSFSLNYPKEKIQYLWVTDGSDDGTPEILKNYSELKVCHEPERKGKINAMNRGMRFVRTPIVIFSDTNTLLGKESIREIVARFGDEKVGCVAGEKRIITNEKDGAAGAGEGLYWKFESWIKIMDAEMTSAVGAAGELFAIRNELYQEVEPDTILDDFIISMRIVQKGYRIAYVPEAYAEETASLNVSEELKRKIRIAAGGIQSILRLKSLLNPFKFGIFSWQYFSHKVLRWSLAPFSLFAFGIVNFFLVWNFNSSEIPIIYIVIFYLQIIFYLTVILGWNLENFRLKFKFLFAPYYFVAINYAAIKGVLRYLLGNQSVKWEKSKRATNR